MNALVSRCCWRCARALLFIALSRHAGLSVLRRPAGGPSGLEHRESSCRLNLARSRLGPRPKVVRHAGSIALVAPGCLATMAKCAPPSSSSGCGPTLPSSGHPKARFACFRLPLMSNVRPQKLGVFSASHSSVLARRSEWSYTGPNYQSEGQESFSWELRSLGHRCRNGSGRAPQHNRGHIVTSGTL
jgi:hypothetical protein